MKEHQIFISYSRSDSVFVIKLEEDLAQAGIFIWLDQKKISGGKLWDRAIEEALESSGILIVVVSQKSALSENVANEVQYAIDEGKIIVPILIEQTRIPLTWRRYQRIDFLEDYDAGLDNLAQTIKNELSQMIKSETENAEQRLKEEEKAKAEEEQRIKADAEAKRIENEKAKEEFLLRENENAKAEEEKRKKEEVEVKARAEEEKRIKDEAEAEVKQKAEQEKRIKKQAERTNKEELLFEASAKNIETNNIKKAKYKIPLVVAAVIVVLVIVVFIVNSGNNNENYLTVSEVSDQTSDVQDDDSEENAWKVAVSLNTIESYKDYQQNYTDGIYFNEAQKKSDEIADENDWQTVLTVNTKQAFQEYLDSHLTGAHVAEAKQKIAEIDNLALQENKRQRIAVPVVDVEETTEKIVDNVLKAESVSHVEYQNGDFKGAFNQIGQLKWQEKNPDGVFSFNEQSRDEWSIYLLDSERNITIQLDLYKKEILYEGSLIYNISKYSKRAN